LEVLEALDEVAEPSLEVTSLLPDSDCLIVDDLLDELGDKEPDASLPSPRAWPGALLCC